MNYLTSSILEKLAREKEENSLVSTELFNETIEWINKFESIPEIEFDLSGDFEYFLPLLQSNEAGIEKTIVAYRKKKQRKYGPVPKGPEHLRSHHIGIYLTHAEMAKLATLSGTQMPEKKRGGDTASRRKMAAYLREASFRTLPPTEPKITFEIWSQLSQVYKTMNQIAKKRNGGGDLNAAYSLVNNSIRDILTVLRPQMIVLKKIRIKSLKEGDFAGTVENPKYECHCKIKRNTGCCCNHIRSLIKTTRTFKAKPAFLHNSLKYNAYKDGEFAKPHQ